IVLDCANGAASKLGPELFRSLGAEVIAMGDLPDGRNINAGCGSMHLDGLEKRVVAEKARLGVGFDGDADRALFVCESGKIVNVQVRSKPPLETLPEVSRALAEAQSALGDKGRVVLRYSGTEQLARVMVEAEHEADVQRFSQSLAKALHSSIGA